MGKISISKFVEEVTKRTGDKADTVLLIAIDGKTANTSVIGIDDLCVDDNSIALVAAMRAVINQKLKVASIIHESLARAGKFKSSFIPMVISTDEKPEDETEAPSKDNTPEQDAMDAFLHALTNLIEQKLGGDDNAHDD